MNIRIRIKEFLTDTVFYVMGGGTLFMVGYRLYLGYEGEHPQPRTHWNQGPQDPQVTR